MRNQAHRPTQPEPAQAESVPGVSWGISRDTPTRIRGLEVFAECLAVGLACGDQHRLTGSGSAVEALRDDALYKSTYFTFYWSKIVIFFHIPSA